MMKSLAIATAAVAFGGAALLGAHTSAQAASPAAKSQEIVLAAAFGGHGKANRHHRKPSRVQAVGMSRGAFIPYFLKKATAQRKAISGWRSKVSRMYGSGYANWNRALGKSTRCSRAGIAVSCRVSAVPRTSFRRFGLLN